MPTSPQSIRRSTSARRQLLAVFTAAFIILSLVVLISALAGERVKKPSVSPPPSAISTSVVISQVYGGAGCGTAGCSTFKNDYIELFNRGSAAQSLNGWSVQYAAATGTAWQVTNLANVTLQPGQYFLVAEGAGANGVNNIPTADTTGTIAMSATAAKVALVNTTTALSGACPTGASIVDLIGYGATASCFETAVAPAPSTTTADVRAGAGCTETDNNSTDFTATTPNPRNTATALNVCGGPPPTPTLNINDVTQAEGDASTSTFNFTVSLTSAAGAGGVSFTVNTADGTTNPATAGSDYVAINGGSGSITSGNTSTTVSVTVNGDTTTEPNETFFVNITNVTGATAGDTQGLGTITNDDVTLTPIHTIQGSGTASPLAGQSVSTRGIVTGIKSGTSGGFFIQEPDATVDADPNTSEGVFVFTGASLPAAAVVGNSVQVTGTVQEFVFASDPNSPPITEISGTITASVLSTGNPLPAPVTLTVANTTAASGTTNPLDTLEEFEGMRVTAPSLTVVAPTDGTINEPNATVSGNDVFYGVVTGVARPFREPGVNISDPLPSGAPANVPRFDENPERIRVDSDGQPGTTAVDVNAGTVLSNVTGPLDYQFRTYTILPDATIAPGTQPGAVPAPTPTASELTVASFNMERFFDTANDPATSDPVLTQTAFDKRLDKASRIIRTVQHYPDVIGVEEMENLTTLQAVATKINADAQSVDGLANPNYVAYLVEGNDIGGIDNGFLVKESRVTTVDVVQDELAGCDHVTPSTCFNYTNPNNGQLDILNDRPPLILRATAPRPAGGTFAFTVIVNHLRSLSGVDDNTVDGTGTVGARVREKRRKQAEFLANLIQSRQTSDATEKIITVGDMNAFQFNDGFVDVIGTVKGTPSPDDQTVVPGDGADLVNPDLTNLVDALPAAQRYSFTFDGNAQVLDQILVNQTALAFVNRFVYARDDADYAVKNYELANELRISDHDQPIVYLSLDATGVAQPVGSVLISEFRFRGPGDTGPASSHVKGMRNAVSRSASITSAPGTPGENDEFIELYNNTDADITVSTTDGSAGWALVASDGVTRFVIPNGTIIPARRHYLAVNGDGYSLSSYATPDLTYTAQIPDGAGIALFRTTVSSSFTLSERLDAVGYASVDALYREGNGLTAGAEVGADLEYSWSRHQCGFVAGVGCTTPGTPKDTGNNPVDFISVDVTGAVQSLGAPGPESLDSPFQRNSAFTVELLNPSAGQANSPNRVRDLTSNPSNNSTFGTMSIRRRVTNNTGGPITYIAFRIIQITTFPAESNATADLRALDSNDITVTVNGTPVDVRGTFVEQPPDQPEGGGLNSSMAVDFTNIPDGQIEAGESVDVQFLLGIEKTGSFRFYINVEAFNESAVGTKPAMNLKTQPGVRPQGGRSARGRGLR